MDLKNIYELRNYEIDTDTFYPLIEFLIENLCTHLEDISRKGLYAEYILNNGRTQFPHGRINFKRSINEAWGKGHEHSVSIDYYKFSRDTAYNRLLKYAILLSISLLESNIDLSSIIKERLKDI